MSRDPSSSSGRGVTPDPLRPLDSIPQGTLIPCTYCLGTGGRLFEGSSRPAVSIACQHCAGRGELVAFWACSAALLGVQHVVRIGDQSRFVGLCDWTIQREHLLAPQGLYCVRCLAALRRAGLTRDLTAADPHPHVLTVLSTKPGHERLRQERCDCVRGRNHLKYENPS